MPKPFPKPEAETWRSRPSSPPASDWLERAMAALPKETTTPQTGAPAAAGPHCAIPNDFSWTAPYVDQQVRKFFRKHWDEYTRAIQAVIDEQMTMEKFSLDFGPKRISDWINKLLNIPQNHPKPCLKQSINISACYGALVKAFKADPRRHAVVQRLQHGRSDEAKTILDEFISEGGPG